MKFYRYNIINYASLDSTGDFISPKIPDPRVVLSIFSLFKETPKGYWIGYGDYKMPGRLRSTAIWVPKTSRKRYAYPSEEEALNSFIKRQERRIKILKYNLLNSGIALDIAKKMTIDNK